MMCACALILCFCERCVVFLDVPSRKKCGVCAGECLCVHMHLLEGCTASGALLSKGPWLCLPVKSSSDNKAPFHAALVHMACHKSKGRQ